MITNLFRIFDPATSSIFSLNWLILTGLLVALPPIFWFSPNRVSTILNNGYFYLVREFKNILAKTPEALISVVTTALAIFTLNI